MTLIFVVINAISVALIYLIMTYHLRNANSIDKILLDLENEYLNYSNKKLRLLVIEATDFEYDSTLIASEIIEDLTPIINALIIKLTVNLNVKRLRLRYSKTFLVNLVVHIEQQYKKHYTHDSKYVNEIHGDGLTALEKKIVFTIVINSIIADLNKRILSLKVGD